MFEAKKWNLKWISIGEESKAIQTMKIFPTYKIVPLKGYKLGGNKEMGKEKWIVRSRQSAECGGNQDVRYQDRSEMTLDYTKLFRWQETSSQGSFHAGKTRS